VPGEHYVAGKGEVASRIASHLPSHKAKQESLHLQGNPQRQLGVINMLRHMADRSNAWRFEILNSLCKTQGRFKFLMRRDRAGTVPASTARQEALLTLPLTVPDKKRFQRPTNRPAAGVPVWDGTKQPFTQGSLRSFAHLWTEEPEPSQLNKQSSNACLAHKNWTNLPTWMKQISSEYTKKAGRNKLQSVSSLGIFTTQNSQPAAYSALQATPSLQFAAATQRSAGRCHPRAFLCNRDRPAQRRHLSPVGAGSSGKGTDGASFPGKYGGAGNRITSHPGKELTLDFRSKRPQ